MRTRQNHTLLLLVRSITQPTKPHIIVAGARAGVFHRCGRVAMDGDRKRRLCQLAVFNIRGRCQQVLIEGAQRLAVANALWPVRIG